MGWLANVLPHTTITSTWGNYIRSHVIHAYANGGDRDTQTVGVRGAGMVAYTSSDNKLSYVGSDGNTWYPLTESLPYIPEWRAGSFQLGSGQSGKVVTFNSPMSLVPVVFIAPAMVDGATQSLYSIAAQWNSVSINGFQVIRYQNAPGYTVDYNWFAIGAR